jgi:hypothetical protein
MAWLKGVGSRSLLAWTRISVALALCLNRVPYSNKVSAPRLGLNQYKEKPSPLVLSLQLRTLLPSLKLFPLRNCY